MWRVCRCTRKDEDYKLCGGFVGVPERMKTTNYVEGL